jgi:uncharacterized protein (DUF58 family)
MDWLILVLIIPLLLMLFLGVLFFHGKELDIEITRQLSVDRVFEDETVEVTVHVHNKGSAIQVLELYDELPKKVKIEKNSNYYLLPLKKDEEITLRYAFSCPFRGQYMIGPLRLRVKDYLGMFFKEKTIEGSAELTVIPRIQEIRNITAKGKVNPYPGLMQTRQTGIGTEFFGIRNYASGDTFRRINWKSFARFNKPLVNEYEMESTTDVIIVLDARDIQRVGTSAKNPLEYGIRGALAVSSQFLKRRDRVGLLVYGASEGKLKWVYPESGKKQLYKLIKEIVAVESSGNFSCNAAINTALTHIFPQKSLIVLISSLEQDPSIPQAVENLIARKFNVIVISPSPIAVEFMLGPQDIYYQVAGRVLSFERNNFLGKIRNAGARVVDWDPALPLAASLNEVERYPSRR